MQLQKLVKICLTASLLLLNSCGGESDFPPLHMYLLNLKSAQCAEYAQGSVPTDFTFVKWHPIADCEGFYALPPQDVANITSWYKTNHPPQDNP